MKLTAQQVAGFNRDGFLIARDALQSTDLQPVIDELNEFIDARANILFTEGKIGDLHKEAPFEKRYGLLLVFHTALSALQLTRPSHEHIQNCHTNFEYNE